MEDIVLNEEDVPGALFTKDPEEYSVVNLKRWLECHGLKQTGKKQCLIDLDRVKNAIAAKTNVDPKIDNGKWYEMKSSKSLVGLAQSSKDHQSPRSTPTVTAPWKPFPSLDIPSMFNYGHIYHYLVESIANFATNNSDSSSDGDGDSFTSTAKPLRKGNLLLKSDFVEDLQDNSNDQYYFLRARVHHSMKREDALKTMIGLSKVSGAVQFAECNCKASALARCSHIAAVLLKLQNFVEQSQLGHSIDIPSTSKPCTWNTGKKRKKTPEAIHKADYSDSKAKAQRILSWDPRPEAYQQGPSSADINEFVKDLKVGICIF